MRALREQIGNVAALIALIAVAVAVGGYILTQQRLRFPLIEATPKRLVAEFSTGQALTPGQGQTVRVSGVKIGDIAGVELRDGRAIVALDIDREFEDMVREDATALLRPKTGLKDMFIEMDPGDGKVAEEGFTIPVRNTLPDVNLDEFLAMLDRDTRDYLRVLVADAATGLDGRGDELRDLYKRFEPLHRDLARVNGKVAERSANLRRLVTNLNRLNSELATKDTELADLVDRAAVVFRAFAREGGNIEQTVQELPSALRQTTDTLARVETFAGRLGPAAERLRGPLGRVDEANAALEPLAAEGRPILADRVRPFVREARPLVRELRPASRQLAAGTPDLTRSFTVLNRFFNLLAFNRDGREGPDDADRQEGYLFWLAWVNHLGGAVFSTADANGPFRPVAFANTCETLRRTVDEEPELEFLQGLTGVLTDPRICGNQ